MGILCVTELNDFRRDYPGMVSRPEPSFAAVLRGTFSYAATYSGKGNVEDSYQLVIKVPAGFPRELPLVLETRGRIPHDGKHHVNPDGSLCLGAPLRLKWVMARNPILVGFAENCLVPHLYSMSRNLLYGEPFVFDELAHGDEGELSDYCALFGLKTHEQVKQALALLALKKRIANKKECPCSCGLRLGNCRVHFRLNEFRKLEYRSYYRSALARLR